MTGGTGFLGQHLAAVLLRQGHTVRILGRTFASVQALVAVGAKAVPVDLRDAPAVKAACAGADVVFHVGALSAPWGKATDFYEINVGGTQSVIEGCVRHHVRRLIFVSSPSVVFDGRDQHNLTEAAPYPRRFASIYSHTKKLGEDLVHAAAEQGLATVILRPKAIFGPGDTTLLPRLIAAAQAGRLPQVGDGQNLVDLTYVDNVVHALLLAMEAPKAAGNTYFITNDEHVPLWDVIKRVLRQLGLQTELRVVPLRLMLVVARLMEVQAQLTGREPLLTRYGAAILGRTQTYNIAAAKQDLQYAPQLTVAEGIERTLRTLKSATPPGAQHQ